MGEEIDVEPPTSEETGGRPAFRHRRRECSEDSLARNATGAFGNDFARGVSGSQTGLARDAHCGMESSLPRGAAA